MSGVKIAGARVVITGAGSGIGRATALRCSRLGAEEVVCVDIDAEAAEGTAASCAGPAAAWQCDVSDAEAVSDLAEGIEERHGPIDVLVNNAGVGVGGPFLETSIEDWDWLISINLDGVAYGCHAFGPGMVERGRGQVVNIASAAAFLMTRDMAAYCASKAAVVAFSRCLRADWSGTGVGVSAICPGVINTPIPGNSRMVGAMLDKREQLERAFRYGHSPDLVAKAIVRAAEKNHGVVPVGVEAEVAYRLVPFVPGPIQGLMARTPLGRFV